VRNKSGDPLTSDRPVFQVDYPYPTTDKPQSKLWYKDGCWWTILPRSGGPSLWQRTDNGWKEHAEVYKALQGVPGRADVWVDKDGITAAGVTSDSLVVFRLNAQKPDRGWNTEVLATLKPPAGENIETATIARDSKGEWWVAADGTNTIYTWHSADGKKWSPAILLKDGVNKDDISVITALHGAVMVTWSNQQEEAVQCRVHIDGHAVTDWEKPVVVGSGNKTADDHLHTALTADGTVWLVSKNSADSNNYPQLVLRVRDVAGHWRNFPYLPRTALKEPSRPAIVVASDPGMLLAGHTIYNKQDKYKQCIEFGEIDTAFTGTLKNIRVVIAPEPSLRSVVNDITVPKDPFPVKGPWLILASDAEGRVYEADLRSR
jgi:hypothetical protein